MLNFKSQPRQKGRRGMRDFEKARPPKGSRLGKGRSFCLSSIVQTHCANSISGHCVMRADNIFLLDYGMRCEYFELVIIPLMEKKSIAEFKPIREKYGGLEKVPAIPIRFPDIRICQTCNKEQLKKGERVCLKCWKTNRNVAKRLQREKKKLGMSLLSTLPTLTPQGLTSRVEGLPYLPTKPGKNKATRVSLP
jgi:hypothetical protein